MADTSIVKSFKAAWLRMAGAVGCARSQVAIWRLQRRFARWQASKQFKVSE